VRPEPELLAALEQLLPDAGVEVDYRR